MPEYHQLDADKFLRQQLSGKVVIEFPVLIVLLPGEETQYSVVSDTDATQADVAVEKKVVIV